MVSTVIHPSIATPTAILSKTHFPLHPLSKDLNVIFNKHSIITTSNSNKKCKKSNSKSTLHEIPKGGISQEMFETKVRVLVAGGGIGGLVFALAAKKKGFDVLVFEKDMTAIRGEGKYRGPIQLQSNALAALEAIDKDVATKVMDASCVNGDRVNGLVDGLSGNWFVKFDTYTPAVEHGLPVTRVISRMTLQHILAEAVGDEVIMNESNVVAFNDDGNKVTVTLENGKSYEGDLLVGADGIWSKIRRSLFGHDEAVYSGYTCYTGIADFVPADIETVGYRIFLGHKKYFVSIDVGGGKMQWYAFHKEAPGGVDGPNGKKQRLLEIFDGWCDNVIDLVMATEVEAIIRRDIYDRTPSFTWGRGRVTLLGDSIHAMQPNMGQGGGMAIEDSFQLAVELEKAWNKSIESNSPVDIASALKRYERARRLRVAIIHGMVRTASMMASMYQSTVDVGLGPLWLLTKLRILHLGIAGGRFLVSQAMPLMFSWVLGGNSERLEGRVPYCSLSDKANDQLQTWFKDDDALERAINGEWFLLPHGHDAQASEPICLSRNEDKSYMIGSVLHKDFRGKSIVLSSTQVSKKHAKLSCKNGVFFVTDLQSEHGTWITNNEGRRRRITPHYPTRFHPSNGLAFGADGKASFRVKVMKTHTEDMKNQRTPVVQASVCERDIKATVLLSR